jgi:DNA-dependent metalloprotease Spartan-like protein
MNRVPGKSDPWWTKHTEECGGTYVKIAEPEKTKKQLEAMSAMERAGRQRNKIDSWVQKDTIAVSSMSAIESTPAVGTKRARSVDDNGLEGRQKTVTCPICQELVPENRINEHLDTQHAL